MRVLLAAIFVIAASLPAAGQGKFIGVDDDPSIGDANAKVLIIEFGDYQCPSCRMFWREVEPRLKKDYVDTGKVKLVFRDFPIVQIHPEAMLAAMAVDCAGDQNKYWQMHDKVFREQDKRGDTLVLRVPYPMGTYSKWLDGRIDDAKAGWKGRGLWTTTSTRTPFHMETGKGTPPIAMHFQMRPDPLAK